MLTCESWCRPLKGWCVLLLRTMHNRYRIKARNYNLLVCLVITKHTYVSLQNLKDLGSLDFKSYISGYNCNYPQLYVGCEVLPGFAHPCIERRQKINMNIRSCLITTIPTPSYLVFRHHSYRRLRDFSEGRGFGFSRRTMTPKRFPKTLKYLPKLKALSKNLFWKPGKSLLSS